MKCRGVIFGQHADVQHVIVTGILCHFTLKPHIVLHLVCNIMNLKVCASIPKLCTRHWQASLLSKDESAMPKACSADRGH